MASPGASIPQLIGHESPQIFKVRNSPRKSPADQTRVELIRWTPDTRKVHRPLSVNVDVGFKCHQRIHLLKCSLSPKSQDAVKAPFLLPATAADDV